MVFGYFFHLFILQNETPYPVSVNKAAKKFVKKFYRQYYSSEVQRQLAAGVGTHDVAVYCRLSVLKAKHAIWIVDIYNKFQSDKGVKKLLRASLEKLILLRLFRWWSFHSKTHLDRL